MDCIILCSGWGWRTGRGADQLTHLFSQGLVYNAGNGGDQIVEGHKSSRIPRDWVLGVFVRILTGRTGCSTGLRMAVAGAKGRVFPHGDVPIVGGHCSNTE